MSTDGNADLACLRESLFVAHAPRSFSNIGSDTGYAAYDVAVLNGPSAGADRLLTAGANGLRIWSPSSSTLFPDLQHAAFSVSATTPALVAVAREAGTADCAGWIVGGDGTVVTPFTWHPATGTASAHSTFSLPAVAARIECIDATASGTQSELVVLHAAGVGVYDLSGDLLFGMTGQATGGLIARIPGHDGNPDLVAYVRKESLSNHRKLFVLDEDGSDPPLNLGQFDYAACAVSYVNNDEVPDLLLTRADEYDLGVLFNDGSLDHTDARFSKADGHAAILHTVETTASGEGALATADLEADGDLDIVWALVAPPPGGGFTPLVEELLFLQGTQICARDLGIELSRLVETLCDTEVEFEIQIEVELVPSALPDATHLRIYTVAPDSEDENALVPDAIDVTYVEADGEDEQAFWLAFDFVGGSRDSVRYIGMQQAELDGSATAAVGPIRWYVVGTDQDEIDDLYDNCGWPLVTDCVPEGEPTPAEAEEGCSTGGEDGGSAGETPKPPPVQPPGGGGGGGG